ncbi:MAG: DUF3006 domain-containing protein [Lachnospiraceae bacterium]|nr:DUF3006 domain-containing protein [Lachnospiraceae bacterium]
MFLKFNPIREFSLEKSNNISNFVKSFLSELQDYFNKPNINPILSKDNYYIDRFEKEWAVLINKRTHQSFFVSKDEFPKEVTDYDPIRIENNKFVIDIPPL